jgi:hypothetical protein
MELTNMLILALDLGNFKTMCCFFNTKTRIAEFQVAATEPDYLAKVFASCKIDLVVMEACGPSGWINDVAISTGLKTLACSANEDAWKWSNVKLKLTVQLGDELRLTEPSDTSP